MTAPGHLNPALNPAQYRSVGIALEMVERLGRVDNVKYVLQGHKDTRGPIVRLPMLESVVQRRDAVDEGAHHALDDGEHRVAPFDGGLLAPDCIVIQRSRIAAKRRRDARRQRRRCGREVLESPKLFVRDCLTPCVIAVPQSSVLDLLRVRIASKPRRAGDTQGALCDCCDKDSLEIAAFIRFVDSNTAKGRVFFEVLAHRTLNGFAHWTLVLVLTLPVALTWSWRKTRRTEIALTNERTSHVLAKHAAVLLRSEVLVEPLLEASARVLSDPHDSLFWAVPALFTRLEEEVQPVVERHLKGSGAYRQALDRRVNATTCLPNVESHTYIPPLAPQRRYLPLTWGFMLVAALSLNPARRRRAAPISDTLTAAPSITQGSSLHASKISIVIPVPIAVQTVASHVPVFSRTLVGPILSHRCEMLRNLHAKIGKSLQDSSARDRPLQPLPQSWRNSDLVLVRH